MRDSIDSDDTKLDLYSPGTCLGRVPYMHSYLALKSHVPHFPRTCNRHSGLVSANGPLRTYGYSIDNHTTFRENVNAH